MNKNSNTYTIVYATILVVVVAAVLSFAAISLAPRQAANVLTEKMGAILSSIGQGKEADTAPNKDAYIAEEFSKYITRTFFVNAQGQETDAQPAEVLDALGNLPAVFEADNALPVFQAKNNEGNTLYVVPVTGKGLWGPVWGYLALNADGNTVEGAVFDHKSETPGLGAEIALPKFQEQFIGKKLFDNGKFKSINLVKGVATTPYEVDAVSGGTLTSNGVRDMLSNCMGKYAPFLEKLQSSGTSTPMVELTPATEVSDSTATVNQ